MGWDVLEASQLLDAMGGDRGDPAINSALGPRTKDKHKTCALKPFKIDELPPACNTHMRTTQRTIISNINMARCFQTRVETSNRENKVNLD
jgi:hypothetical protein